MNYLLWQIQPNDDVPSDTTFFSPVAVLFLNFFFIYISAMVYKWVLFKTIKFNV